MSEPIDSLDYWRERLQKAKSAQLHQAIFLCSLQKWRAIEAAHRKILKQKIAVNDSILDAGCAWGRLIDLMPTTWRGDYVGVDLSPDFIELGREKYPDFEFHVGDLRQLPAEVKQRKYDWAILISIRPMVKRNLGDEVWEQMEAELRTVANDLLFLEYEE